MKFYAWPSSKLNNPHLNTFNHLINQYKGTYRCSLMFSNGKNYRTVSRTTIMPLLLWKLNYLQYCQGQSRKLYKSHLELKDIITEMLEIFHNWRQYRVNFHLTTIYWWSPQTISRRKRSARTRSKRKFQTMSSCQAPWNIRCSNIIFSIAITWLGANGIHNNLTSKLMLRDKMPYRFRMMGNSMVKLPEPVSPMRDFRDNRGCRSRNWEERGSQEAIISRTIWWRKYKFAMK